LNPPYSHRSTVSIGGPDPGGEVGILSGSVRHSELTDSQLARLAEALAGLGANREFSATQALAAALEARIENPLADIDSALGDLEDAGVIREVQTDPPRWRVVGPDA
jgi:hypothetical protein